MSVRMRVTKGHTGNRRSHHKIKLPRLSKCSNCGAYHIRHRVCPECGYYRGKQVIDVVALAEKQAKKAQAQQEESQSNEVGEDSKDDANKDDKDQESK